MLLGNFEQKFFFTLWSVTIFTLVKQHNQSVVKFYLAYIVQSTFLPVPICDQYYLQVKCSCAHIVIRNISLQTEKVLGFTNKIKVSISGLTVKLCKNVRGGIAKTKNFVELIAWIPSCSLSLRGHHFHVLTFKLHKNFLFQRV